MPGSLDYLYAGSADDFISSLAREVLEHPCVHHPYLKGLASGAFADMPAALRDYAHQYSFYSRWFPRYVEGVMSNTKDPEILGPLNHNLEEELGDPNSDRIEDRPHTEIYADFKTRVGIDAAYEAVHPMSTTVAIWRDLFLQKCRSGNIGIGLGAISLATEFIVPHVYPHIIDCIDNHTDFDRDTALFFRLHVECDAEHAEEALEVTRYVAQDASTREAIRFGTISALNLRHAFWDAQLARALHLPEVAAPGVFEQATA